ncbi:hypothetical protein BV20DRAFT_118590 [Pilatotrama ljubarskyi]|nr:hypothetical protein BV20DRAFT_118590 [Pilatotrama ljubarskyi]
MANTNMTTGTPGLNPAALPFNMSDPAEVQQVLGLLLSAVRSELPSLQDTFGAYLICTCLGCMLFGLTTHQTYRYYRLYPTDGISLKFLVASLLALDILHTITSIHVCYFYLVTNYFNPLSMSTGVWSIRLGIVETGLVILVAHCFYARRLFLLGNGHLFPVSVIGLLLFAEIGFSIAATVESFIQVSFEKFFKFQWLIWVILAVALMVDLVATSILTFYLRRSRTGFKRTDSMVDVLMVYAINTGLSTSVLTFAALICSIAAPHTLIWAAITVPATKMYANSLLAVLNSRRSLIDKGLEGFETGSFGLKVIDPPRPIDRASHAFEFNPASPRLGGRQKMNPTQTMQTVIDVKVTRETYLDGPAEPARPESALEYDSDRARHGWE